MKNQAIFSYQLNRFEINIHFILYEKITNILNINKK